MKAGIFLPAVAVSMSAEATPDMAAASGATRNCTTFVSERRKLSVPPCLWTGRAATMRMSHACSVRRFRL